jgi:hypothetical protein
MRTGRRGAGEFCWINILSSQLSEAKSFFGALFGWTYVEMPGMGYRVQVGGREIGGLWDLANPGTPPGTPPGIGVMVKVDSADATVNKVISLGGKAKPAFDIMEQGRMAECFDPNGAQFDLWEPKRSHGADADSSLHGSPSWHETMTTDVARASAFYTSLFGWKAEVMPMEGFEYTSFKLGEEFVAGMMAITPEMGPIPPHWAVYFTVDDVDRTVREALALGAASCVPAQDIPGVGRFSGLTSPQGVMFYVIKYAR